METLTSVVFRCQEVTGGPTAGINTAGSRNWVGWGSDCYGERETGGDASYNSETMMLIIIMVNDATMVAVMLLLSVIMAVADDNDDD